MHYMGFDCSTQQLKVIIVDENLSIVYENFVIFEKELPHYKARNGVRISKCTGALSAPVLMWIEALDLLLEKMKQDKVDLASVAAVSGAGQQHGSAYWRQGAKETLHNLSPDRPLHEQLSESFSLLDSPIWMDSTTTEQCREIERALGGPKEVAQRTGSRVFERYTGPQIMKIFETKPEAYDLTERICLVSSLMCSLFLGDYAPVDEADASGMAMMNLSSRQFDPEILEIIAPNLAEKLGQPCPSYSTLGTVSPYMVARHGFSSNCRVVAFTGDNPSSLAGMRLREGDLCLSLGSSDTLLLSSSSRSRLADPTLTWTAANPVSVEAYMSISCFKNGSLVRQRICDQCASGSWEKFQEILKVTPPGNDGYIGFFFDEREIIPQNILGTFLWDREGNPVSEFSPEVTVRAVIEGQVLAKRAHMEQLGFAMNADTRLLVTGGASKNEGILQIIADVFGLQVYTGDVANSAALGSAYRAKHGSLGGAEKINFNDVVKQIKDYSIAAVPAPSEERKVYDVLMERYKALERSLSVARTS